MNNDKPESVIQFEINDFPEFNLLMGQFGKLYQKHHDSFFGSLVRSYELVELYDTLSHDPKYESNTSLKDIVRAAVVFAHGTLEEFLRELGIELLLKSSDAVSKLRDIPLANGKNRMRTEKFTLVDLEKFRGNSIDDVLSKSVVDYYQRTTYNNIDDIINLLRSLEIPHEGVEGCLPDIALMIQRRHEIVHKTDAFKKDTTQNKKDVSDITAADALRWIHTLIIFMYGILFSLASKQLISEGAITELPKLEIKNIKVTIRGRSLN